MCPGVPKALQPGVYFSLWKWPSPEFPWAFAMMTLYAGIQAQVLCNLIAAVRGCDRACSAYWPRHSQPQAIPVRSQLLNLSRRSSLPAPQPDKDIRAREKSETTPEELSRDGVI